MIYQYQHFGVSEHFCKEYGTNFSFPRHIHRSFELVTVLSGRMDVSVAERVYTVEPGQAVLIFPDQIHSLESLECEHMLIIFSPETVSAYYSSKSGLLPTCNIFDLDPHLLDRLKKLDSGCSTVKMKGVLYSVCDLLDGCTQYIKRERSDGDLLQRIFDYVEKNCNLEISLESVSASLGYSNTYISRYFKSMTGTSFISFVNQHKVSRACYLLSNTEKTVLECSLECGYASLRNFNRNFKLYTGKTPAEFRNSNDNGGK